MEAIADEIKLAYVTGFRLPNQECFSMGIMQTLAERIRDCLGEKTALQKELAAACGVSPVSVSQWLSGTTKSLEGKNLVLAARFLGVTEGWLATGIGPKLPRNLRLENVASLIPTEADYATIDQFHANGSCGDGYLNEHVEIRGSMAFKRDWLARMNIDPNQAGVIYAKGDSMAPTIQDGEVLLVDYRQTEPQGNRVYVLNVEGDLRVKRLLRRVAGWVIVSDNQDKTRYPDETIPNPSAINIVGRVVWRGGGL